VTVADGAHCPRCGETLVRRNRAWLSLWAVVFGLAAAIGLRAMVWLAGPALILLAVAAYLGVWALWAKGRWCRTCKTFPGR
jgi:hypothetical protein